MDMKKSSLGKNIQILMQNIWYQWNMFHISRIFEVFLKKIVFLHALGEIFDS